MMKTVMKTTMTIASPNIGLSMHRADREEEYNPDLE
jgi:hypothetical protein